MQNFLRQKSFLTQILAFQEIVSRKVGAGKSRRKKKKNGQIYVENEKIKYERINK